MIFKAVLALFAVVFVLCSNADASIHPNPKKIAKWEGKITKLQAKIDAENHRTSAMVVSQVFTQFQPAAPAAPAPSEPAAEAPAPPVQYVAPPPVIQYRYTAPDPVVIVNPWRPYLSVRRYGYSGPVVRTYRAVPVLGCPTFGQAVRDYHARQAERHLRKADYHAARS